VAVQGREFWGIPHQFKSIFVHQDMDLHHRTSGVVLGDGQLCR
jgi:hypothetical protein